MGPDGQCRGIVVFDVAQGNLDGTSLGRALGPVQPLPLDISSGNWRVGIAVDEGTSDEQARAVERIVSGEEGGPFGDRKALIGWYLGMERSSVSLSDGGASGGRRRRVHLEPFRGPDGTDTTVSKAMFGFAPEYTVGETSGRFNLRVGEVEAIYGESANDDYSSEMGGVEVRPRA
jgi:hypothetical protein